ncbi:MAG TPA: phosphoribosylanthranilate isomerase [Terriglobales bacterium]|nr:phosphoribosylanthranilate isomerase [Terriglobales bacterium]
MTWVKICGITNLQDALTAVGAGADALGFVFYEKSPRCVAPEDVQRIIANLPDGVEKVGVFVDQPAGQIAKIVERTGLTAVQVYQKECVETLSYYSALNPPAHRSPPKIIFVVPGDQFADPRGVFWGIPAGFKDILYALLVDCISGGQFGGSGRRFDWIKVGAMPAMNLIRPTIVAGGLTASNVATAMALLQPWGVDVSSGVEAGPGRKDPEKVREFISVVRNRDRENQ